MSGEATSGSGVIDVGETEILIETEEANENYRIYITPVGNTFGEVLYVDDIQDGESFKVKINGDQAENIKFNWLIIR